MQIEELLELAENIRNKDVENKDYERLAIILESLYNIGLDSNSNKLIKILLFIDSLYD